MLRGKIHRCRYIETLHALIQFEVVSLFSIYYYYYFQTVSYLVGCSCIRNSHYETAKISHILSLFEKHVSLLDHAHTPYIISTYVMCGGIHKHFFPSSICFRSAFLLLLSYTFNFIDKIELKYWYEAVVLSLFIPAFAWMSSGHKHLLNLAWNHIS